MAELSQRLAKLSPAKRQLLEQRLKKNTNAAEPIAIVGMACRFPGAPDLASYWQVIRDGIDATGEIPNTRWDVDSFFDPTGQEQGKMSTRWAGMIDGPDQFDSLFFGITPREAKKIDPQQRLLLEVAWETFENAGLAPEQLSGSATGVFIGVGGTDYSKLAVPCVDYYDKIDAYSGTGNALSLASNRISYVLDLRGPSMSIDTACSSGMIGIHLAVQSLRNRECNATLAGGVNMILTPETTIAFSQARMLSADGRCRPFDAGANGYVRGEGCGILLLKRLTDATRDGDNILAVLRASAVNQDGRTSGITAPNALSQQRVIRTALAQADLTSDRISYIEAHGTGTPLGDPIEMQALSKIFRRQSHEEPYCHVTSVKANVGHMETASGIAGLIKVILMLQHGQIPAQLHLEKINPNIQLDGTRLHIPTETTEWETNGQSRVAGVSSFGFGGANTHVILEEATPPVVPPPNQDRPLHLLTLSAKTDTALDLLTGRYVDYLQEQPDVYLPDVCFSASHGRTHFNYRLTVAATDRKQLLDRLRAAQNSQRTKGVKRDQVRFVTRPKIAMIFSGQGSQYAGMGRALYDHHPIFRKTLQRLDETFYETVGTSLLSVLYPKSKNDSRINDTVFTQPALFALEYALAELWRSWGVEPNIVLGHSIGEYVACCVADILSPEDGLRLIAHRASLMQQVSQDGQMAVLFTGADRVADSITAYLDEVSIAAANGPENTVISGRTPIVQELVDRFKAAGVDSQLLTVSHAFHSPLMEPMLDEFHKFASSFSYKPPRIPVLSNLTGELFDGAPDAQYLCDHIRGTVRFAKNMQVLANQDLDMILEVGPSTSLLGMGQRCQPNLEVMWLPSLRKGQEDWQVLFDSLASLHVAGVKIDWQNFDKPWSRRRTELPGYPFERSSYWYIETPHSREAFTSSARGSRLHPLLGCRIPSALNTTLFETRIGSRSPKYLIDHQVQGSVVPPAAAYIEQALAAADQIFGTAYHGLDNVTIQQAMFLTEGSNRLVQLTVSPETSGSRMFETYSAGTDDETTSPSWTLHACGTLVPADHVATDRPKPIDLAAIRTRVVTSSSGEEFYTQMAHRGLTYGSSFQVLDQLQRTDRDALAQVQLNEDVQRQLEQYQLHPALLDALFQSMASVVPLEEDDSYSPYTYMPVGVRSVRMFHPLAETMFTYAVRTSEEDGPSPETVEGNVLLLDNEGQVIVELAGVRVQRLGRSQLTEQQHDIRDWLYQIRWSSKSLDPISKTDNTMLEGTWLLFGPKSETTTAITHHVRRRGGHVVIVSPGEQFTRFDDEDTGETHYQVRPLHGEDYRQLFENIFGGENSPRCAGVIHLWSLDIPSMETIDSEPLDIVRQLGCGSVLQLIQQMARFQFKQTPELWLLTCGAQPVAETDDVNSPFQSSLWGLGRVGAMEIPDQKCRLVDLDGSAEVETNASCFTHELSARTDDNQIAFRAGKRFVARLDRAREAIPDANTNFMNKAIPKDSPFRLRLGTTGSFDSLWYEASQRRVPEAGQIEIDVYAAGLNFSDVLKAMGLYPGIKDDIVPLGIECSGVVTGVGPEVNRFQIGDEVMGVAPYSFASHAITADYAVVPKPSGIDHQEACTIPITFLTAYYGLCRLAQLSAGERVLIHAGAGGVGLAAIQIAKHRKAEIFATAGSDEKRDYLRSLGVEHVMNSRTLDFADEILEITNREGVDVVLNSLPGDAITKSLESLRSYGRFLEIGKTDIYQNRMIGLLPFQDNLSYFAIDLDRMLRQRSTYIRDMFLEMMQFFDSGSYSPLAFTQFPMDDTIGAFRYMAQRKNIGKVVLSLEDREHDEESNEPTSNAIHIRPDSTYLITGGLGALGLRVANWLAQEGAEHVALVSRRRPSDDAATVIESFRKTGLDVTVLQGNVIDPKSLQDILAQINDPNRPLRGIVHAAGVLADGVLYDMDWEQFTRAMDPKVVGTWNLHQATRDQPLDFFLLFSSVAAVLGSPGQGNYAAGNAFLDSFAAYRRAQGLPATSINWGPWADSGMAAEDDRGDSIQSRGINLLPPKQGIQILDRAMRSEVTNLVVMDAHWPDLMRLFSGQQPPLLKNMEEKTTASEFDATSLVNDALRAKLLATEGEERESLLRVHFTDELANIMGIDSEELDLEQPLNTLGLDSLMAMELKNKIESQLLLSLPMARFLEGPSTNQLVAIAADLIASNGESAKSKTDTQRTNEEWSPLVLLQSAGELPPLFCVHPAGGDVRCYVETARQMGNNRPVYVLRARGIEEAVPPHETIETMATDYLAAIKKAQPNGPYHLAGWSTGGIFAYEMAKQLGEQGLKVGSLIFIDSPTPSIFGNIDLDDDARFLYDLVNFSNYFADAEMSVSYEQLQNQNRDERLQTVLHEAIKHHVVPPDVSTDHIRRLIDVARAHSGAIMKYEPPQLALEVNIIRPEDVSVLAKASGQKIAADLGWSDFITRPFNSYQVPGDHFSMSTRENATHLARQINACLADE